ncbi:hypothetical protein D0T12_29695 [Actinomadura spongiicola]|uniref:Uncharacterized protein n=1 Tax=Actinomadura spongiicola TaxID=2303421 RepID=A0A372G918_9ACTN|nr:hypothetical protein [Actinomadura spongiicola]RFS81886.1 hypothetical protein D0T12_29695 [Actinomadura spongiicola]
MLDANDRARPAQVKRVHGAEPADPRLRRPVIGATRQSTSAPGEPIAVAARTFRAAEWDRAAALV